MRANLPRSYMSLPPSEKRKIEELAEEQMNKDMMVMLDIFMKMSCCVLHDAFGFGKHRMIRYLGNYRRVFKKHVKLVRKGEQLPYLDERMREIFGSEGYPDEFFKSMFEDWSVKT